MHDVISVPIPGLWTSYQLAEVDLVSKGDDTTASLALGHKVYCGGNGGAYAIVGAFVEHQYHFLDGGGLKATRCEAPRFNLI
jgi:hypothetical protein